MAEPESGCGSNSSVNLQADQAERTNNPLSEEQVSALVLAGLAGTTDDPTLSTPQSYPLTVEHNQNDRAVEIKVCSTARPHMRAFHCAWIGFFWSFFIWFSVSPLLGEVAKSLDLSLEQIWTSTICSDLSTLLTRFILGPICDVYGARILMALVLCIASIPTALTGTANTFAGFCALRFFIGIAGSAFVMAQYWTGRMFCREIIGSANALVAGWGNLGGGMAQLIMGAALFPLFKLITGSADKSWRIIFVFPAVVALIVGLVIVRISDDAPQGLYKEMKKKGQMDIKPVSFRTGTASRNAWLMAILYACSFGVEITMNNALSLYFAGEFGLSTEAAAAVSSIFGSTNLFARACGGILSDKLNLGLGMRGRLWLQTCTIFFQGAATIGFAHCDTLASAIPVMTIMSILVNATEGAIFGVVPYVNPPVTGKISGIVGSGGNVGGVIFGVCFQQFAFTKGFIIMGVAAVVSSILNIFIHVPGYSNMLTRENAFAESKLMEGPPADDTDDERRTEEEV